MDYASQSSNQTETATRSSVMRHLEERLRDTKLSHESKIREPRGKANGEGDNIVFIPKESRDFSKEGARPRVSDLLQSKNKTKKEKIRKKCRKSRKYPLAVSSYTVDRSALEEPKPPSMVASIQTGSKYTTEKRVQEPKSASMVASIQTGSRYTNEKRVQEPKSPSMVASIQTGSRYTTDTKVQETKPSSAVVRRDFKSMFARVSKNVRETKPPSNVGNDLDSTGVTATVISPSQKKGESLSSSSYQTSNPSLSRFNADQYVASVVNTCSARTHRRLKKKVMLRKAILAQKLPICSSKDQIIQHIKKNRVSCIHGETGCGKSTMVPLFITEDFYTKESLCIKEVNIVVTQPRRLAAKELALRVASLLDEEPGVTVGYKISREKKVSASTRITYVTTGFLLQMLVNKPETFCQFTHVILDEIHERQTDNDLLSLVVKLCLEKYWSFDTKIIVMSATLQGELFSRYFSGAAKRHFSNSPTPDPIFVGVKMHNVKEVYLENLLYGALSYEARPIRWSLEEVQAIASATRNFNGSFPGKKPPAVVKEEFMKIGVKLIQVFGCTGETILVFLPGIVEIQDMYDKLEPLERESQSTDRKFRFFVLHSQIPQDEQRAAFETPPSDTVHVILATNIAESSLTLPKVRIVIDYGIRKQLLYDTKCKMTVLRNSWISQASACQRKGRTGRVFEGIVFRMFTKQFFNQMEEFDPPEIETSPLDKLVLKVKHMGRNIAPGETVTNLLSKAVQPPDLEQLEEAVERLSDLGALTENRETADITLLGRVAISLPLDLLPCRLVVFGVLFGCPCDAVVMAASMSLRMEPFSLPCLMIMKDVHKFLRSLERSFENRVLFDEGQYSEPMMMKNVMKKWLKEVKRYGYDDTSEIHNSESIQTGKKKGINHLRKDFARKNGLDAKRLREFEHAVADIASRVARFLPPNGEAHKKLSILMQILYTGQEEEETGVIFGDDPSEDPEGSNSEGAFDKFVFNQTFLHLDPSKLFVDDPLVVKSLLTAAFSPNYVTGTCYNEMKAHGSFMVNKSERTAQAMTAQGLDPTKSLAINNVLSNMNRALFRGNHRLINSIVSLTCKPSRTEIEGTGDRVFLQFILNMPQNYSVVHDIPYSAHILNQFGEGRNKFQVPIKRGTATHRMCQRDQITFDRPVQPFKVNWNYRHQKPQEVRCEREMQGFPYSCRNPVGFMCDTRGRNIQHFAVAAKIRGKSGAGNPGCLLQDLTVLPSEKDGIFAKVMMITFTSQRINLQFLMSHTTIPPSVVGVNVSGHELRFTKEHPFSMEWLPLINEIRREISKVFQQRQVDKIQIPDTNLKPKLERLFQEIRRTTDRNTGKQYRYHGAEHNAVCPFDPRDVDDKFYILKPFDIPTLKARNFSPLELEW